LASERLAQVKNSVAAAKQFGQLNFSSDARNCAPAGTALACAL
jgi:hypothetical protein